MGVYVVLGESVEAGSCVHMCLVVGGEYVSRALSELSLTCLTFVLVGDWIGRYVPLIMKEPFRR